MSKWKKVKLGDVCSLYQPKTIPTKELKDDMPYYVYGANGIIGKYHSYNHIDSEIAIACRGATCGTVNITLPKSWITGNAMVAHIESNELSFKYLFYALSNANMKNVITGAAQPQITRSNLKDLEIPLPAMEEQKKIAARLDAVSDLLAKQKQLLSEQDTLIQSTFYDMFLKQNFSKRKIVDFVETDVKNAKKIFNKNNFIKYIDISSIDNDSNIITGYTHIEFCDAPSRAQQVVKKNDILVSTVRPNLKNIALIKFNDNNLVASSGFCVLRAKNIEPVFLLYNVLSQDFTEKMVSAVTGANYPAIKNSDILNYKIPVPPLELQEKFAAIVEQIESEKSKIKSAITETQTLFNALMSEYFED